MISSIIDRYVFYFMKLFDILYFFATKVSVYEEIERLVKLDY